MAAVEDRSGPTRNRWQLEGTLTGLENGDQSEGIVDEAVVVNLDYRYESNCFPQIRERPIETAGDAISWHVVATGCHPLVDALRGQLDVDPNVYENHFITGINRHPQETQLRFDRVRKNSFRNEAGSLVDEVGPNRI